MSLMVRILTAMGNIIQLVYPLVLARNLISFVIGGMVIGSSVTTAALSNAFFFFSIPALLPLVMRFLAAGTEITNAMGLMLAVLFCSSIIISKRVHATIVQAIESSLKNENEIEERKRVEGELRQYKNQLEEIVDKRTAALREEVAVRRQTEDALRVSNERYHQITANLPGLVYQFALHADGSYSMPYVSEGVTPMFGVKPEEVRQDIQAILTFLHPDDLPGFAHSIQESAESLATYNHEFRALINGKVLWLNARSCPKKRANGDIIWDGILIDITALKLMEEEKRGLESQLRQAHKMEAIGTMAGGIAHDFNNILAAMLGYADMARDDMADSSPGRYHIEEVLKAGYRAKDLVKHILAYSRKEPQTRMPISIYHIVKDALKFLRATIPSTIHIKESLDSTCGNILGDSTQIHQIINNLCTNAAQAMEESGGVLEVTLSSLQLENDLVQGPELPSGWYVVLCVTDNGHGIAPKDIDRIFDPYFTTKEVGKGSGMGLSVVLGIVKSHEGGVTVKSQPGEGTTLKVFIPRIEDEVLKQTHESGSLPVGDEHILIVDDDASIARLTQRRLEKLGYQAIAMTSSLDALEIFRTAPNAYDLVITDQTMPHMTGEQLAREMLEIRPDLPIILSTGYSSRMDAVKAGSIGIRTFIMKPVDQKELAKSVREALDRCDL